MHFCHINLSFQLPFITPRASGVFIPRCLTHPFTSRSHVFLTVPSFLSSAGDITRINSAFPPLSQRLLHSFSVAAIRQCTLPLTWFSFLDFLPFIPAGQTVYTLERRTWGNFVRYSRRENRLRTENNKTSYAVSRASADCRLSSPYCVSAFVTGSKQAHQDHQEH